MCKRDVGGSGDPAGGAGTRCDHDRKVRARRPGNRWVSHGACKRRRCTSFRKVPVRGLRLWGCASQGTDLMRVNAVP